MSCALRGCRVIRGYRQVRLMHKGKYYHKNFGIDNSLAHELAHIHIGEKRKEILMGRFGVTQELPVRSFAEAARLYFERWRDEKDAEGKLAHRASDEAGRVIRTNLEPFFGGLSFESIRPVDIIKWRQKRLRSVLGTSVNREQAVLSSIFSHIERWVKTEEILAFKVPAENPCDSVEKAPTRKRSRVLTPYEAKKLKLAFVGLNDADGWEICKLALKSVLSTKDLRALELGQEIDIDRAKTGVGVNLPIVYLTKLNWNNWERRWDAARERAGLTQFTTKLSKGRAYKVIDKAHESLQFRDLRKTGINWLKGRHDLKLISEYAGHADIKTTEQSYTINQAAYLKPLADDLGAQVDAL